MLAAWAGWSSSLAGRGARAGCCSLCGRTCPSSVSWSIKRREIHFYIQVAGQQTWNGPVVSTGSRYPDKTSMVFWKRLDGLWKQPVARWVPAALAKVWEHEGSSLPNIAFRELESMGTVHKQKSWLLNAWNCGGVIILTQYAISSCLREEQQPVSPAHYFHLPFIFPISTPLKIR